MTPVSKSLTPAWHAALHAFDADLRAPRRRGQDAGCLRTSTASSSPAGRPGGAWTPATVDVRALRRYVASLTAGRPGAEHRRAQARRRCAGCSRVQVDARRARREPRRPAQRAQAPAAPAAGAQGRRGGGCCSTASPPPPAGAARPGAVRARLRLPGCAPRSSSRSTSASIDFDAETVRVEGKGDKTRLVPVGEHALRRARALPGHAAAPAAGPRRRSRARRAVPLQVRPAAVAPRTSGGGCARGRGWPRAQAPGARRGPSRTRCATPSPPTCWRAAPTCARFRSCSAMPASRRRRFTLG